MRLLDDAECREMAALIAAGLEACDDERPPEQALAAGWRVVRHVEACRTCSELVDPEPLREALADLAASAQH